MIPTKTLKFWGFRQHPFADNTLKGDSLKLFVAREVELEDLEDALGHSRIAGVYGTLGVGKSSFLQKLRIKLEESGNAVALVSLTADSKETFFREVLSNILFLYQEKKIQLKTAPRVNIEQERLRMEATVAQTRGADFGGRLIGIGGDLKESRSIEVSPHTEFSAISVVDKLFEASQIPLIVILDDFEKLQYWPSAGKQEHLSILSRFIATLDDNLTRDTVTFVISMDDQVTDLVANARKRGGSFSFALNHLIQLPNLKPQELADLIRIRLKAQGWNKPLRDFIPEDSFWALCLASENHPRRALNLIAEGMKQVAMRQSKEKRIDLGDMLEATKKIGEAIDAQDWLIVGHLAKSGGGSESDVTFQKAVGLTRNPLSKRISKLNGPLGLEIENVKLGKTYKLIYSLPQIDLS